LGRSRQTSGLLFTTSDSCWARGSSKISARIVGVTLIRKDIRVIAELPVRVAAAAQSFFCT
jgi:hypothetical protein